MKKELIFVLALLLMLASCSNSGTTTVTNQRSFIGGTDGLIVNFVEGEPPSEVTDGGATPFTVSVKLENKGETFISADNLSLKLRGIDPIIFGLNSSSEFIINPTEDILENDINPDTGEAINSPPVFVTFPELNFMDTLSGNSDFPIFVDVCYQYTTLASAKLCIKEDLMDNSDEVCKVTGTKEVENSGAPVQITSFEEFSAGKNAVSFSFKVKNVGNGLLSAQGSSCDETPAAENYVRVFVDTGISGLSCSGLSNPSTEGTSYAGTVKLATGERQIRCTQQLSESDKIDKVMIVDLNLDYDYQESKSTTLLVKHI